MPDEIDFRILYRYAYSRILKKRADWDILKDRHNLDDVMHKVMEIYIVKKSTQGVPHPRAFIRGTIRKVLSSEAKNRKKLDFKFPRLPEEGCSENDTSETIALRAKVKEYLEKPTLSTDELAILKECLERLSMAEYKLLNDYFLKDSTTRSLQASYSVSYVIIAKRAKEIRRKVRDCVEGE